MSTSGYIFIAKKGTDPVVGTLAGVNFGADRAGQELATIVGRDGADEAARILSSHEWRLLSSSHAESGEVGRFGAVPGYGEYYVEDPEEMPNLQLGVALDELNFLTSPSRHVHILGADGSVTSR